MEHVQFEMLRGGFAAQLKGQDRASKRADSGVGKVQAEEGFLRLHRGEKDPE